ncbi:MAG TPA: hemerythrin domain-containing protein [Burkholderiales bacterium]|nr:hemerythrin domain-containing protein [Burkholderiales bacterium]
MKAIQKIRDEHRSISAVLHGLKQLARDAQDARVKPDFAVFRAMIHYIDAFPEVMHHPKEDEFLFPPLVARVPEMKNVVDLLRREHEQGAQLVRELERALVFFEDSWPAGADKFLATVDAYADFHWHHMRREEQEILPAVEKYFSTTDKAALEEAFNGNADPIAGVREKDFQELFSRIVRLAPAPVGLGERWKKADRAA